MDSIVWAVEVNGHAVGSVLNKVLLSERAGSSFDFECCP